MGGHVYLWLIYVDVWQEPLQYCKVVMLQLKKKKKRILEWVAILFPRGSSQPRDQTWVSCIAGRFLPSEPPGKPFPISAYPNPTHSTEVISTLHSSLKLSSTTQHSSNSSNASDLSFIRIPTALYLYLKSQLFCIIIELLLYK